MASPTRCLVRRLRIGTGMEIASCWALLGAITFFAGCDIGLCANNECSDGLFCNGPELCTIDGGTDHCWPFMPVECDEGMVCDEELDACVPIADAAKSFVSRGDG